MRWWDQIAWGWSFTHWCLWVVCEYIIVKVCDFKLLPRGVLTDGNFNFWFDSIYFWCRVYHVNYHISVNIKEKWLTVAIHLKIVQRMFLNGRFGIISVKSSFFWLVENFELSVRTYISVLPVNNIQRLKLSNVLRNNYACYFNVMFYTWFSL